MVAIKEEMIADSPLVEQMVLPDLVPNAEGIEGAEGVGPRGEREPRRAQRRRRLQHQAPHPFPARHETRDETTSPSVSSAIGMHVSTLASGRWPWPEPGGQQRPLIRQASRLLNCAGE